MYQREVLGLEEARAAAEAVLKESARDPGRPTTVAVVDDRGDLIYFARMDGAYPIFVQMALNKAYTAARTRRHAREFINRQRELKREIGIWGDNRMTAALGGLCIKKSDGTVLGGIGVSGRLEDEDEELAYLGLEALKL